VTRNPQTRTHTRLHARSQPPPSAPLASERPRRARSAPPPAPAGLKKKPSGHVGSRHPQLNLRRQRARARLPVRRTARGATAPGRACRAGRARSLPPSVTRSRPQFSRRGGAWSPSHCCGRPTPRRCPSCPCDSTPSFPVAGLGHWQAAGAGSGRAAGRAACGAGGRAGGQSRRARSWSTRADRAVHKVLHRCQSIPRGAYRESGRAGRSLANARAGGSRDLARGGQRGRTQCLIWAPRSLPYRPGTPQHRRPRGGASSGARRARRSAARCCAAPTARPQHASAMSQQRVSAALPSPACPLQRAPGTPGPAAAPHARTPLRAAPPQPQPSAAPPGAARPASGHGRPPSSSGKRRLSTDDAAAAAAAAAAAVAAAAAAAGAAAPPLAALPPAEVSMVRPGPARARCEGAAARRPAGRASNPPCNLPAPTLPTGPAPGQAAAAGL
jgi:hypothetical protein